MYLPTTTLYADYRVTRSFTLPEHSGSTFRGVMRRALRAGGCDEAVPCDGHCGAPACVVARLLGAGRGAVRKVNGASPFGDAAASRPSQALYPLLPEARRRRLKAGAQLQLGARLFGDTDDAMMVAVQQMFESLEGFGLTPSKGRLALQALSLAGGRRNIIHDSDVNRNDARCRRAAVRLLTPAWVEHDGQLLSEHTFGRWFDAIHRRLTRLASAFGHFDDADQQRYERMREAARGVKPVVIQLHHHRWTRQPQQGSRHPMRGLVGKLAFRGNLARFAPYLRLAELAGVGKATSFGLGRLAVNLHPGSN